MKKYFLPILLVFIVNAVQAQQELATHFLKETWQSTYTNPAFVPENKWTIAVSGLHYNYQHPTASINDLFQTSNGQTVINLSNLISNLEEENTLTTDFDIPTLEVAYRMGDLRLSLGHQIRFHTQVDYPKSLPELIWNGNAPYIGETIEFGPSINTFSYSEIGLGAAYELGNLTLGAKLKYLSGIGNITTQKNQASVYTSDDIYQLTFQTDYEIQTAAFLEINEVDDLNFRLNQNFGQLFSKNTGVALDFGIRYQVNEKLGLSASVLDLGSINWKEGKTYHSNGNYTYEGIDLADFILDDELEFDVKLDTLRDVFQFEETTSDYSTSLTNKFYLGADYQLNDKLTLGALYYMERNELGNSQAFSLSARAKLLKMLTLGLTYSARYEKFDNIGLNLVAKVGPVQFFGMTDNVLGIAGGAKRLNGRLGLNVLF